VFPIRDSLRPRHAPFAAWLLILANAAAFAYELSMPPKETEQLLFRYGLVPAHYGALGTWLHWSRLIPFFSMQFLHGGWLHVLGNIWFLHIFGTNVEDRMGSLNFLKFYIFCGLAAGLTHLFMNPESTVPAIGASGAISGILGAYFLMFPRARLEVFFLIIIIPVTFQLPAFLYLGLWFYMQWKGGVLSLALPAASTGIAFWAHVGGFATGLLAHRLFLRAQGK
jgi:membrane associated rhomboid family serine protease